MRGLRSTSFSAAFVLIMLVLAMPLRAASMGVSEGHDLDELWKRAEERFDLSRHDAVLLLEGRHVSILEKGDVRTRIHRVVWIGTEIGIDGHADLRIPWNAATSTLRVVRLRTWRDGAWWPDDSEVSETAVVETLPFTLAQAADYATMRETMLLHDGVELPCIVETIFEIEERGSAGSDGLWIFPQEDPAVVSEFTLQVPAGVAPAFRSGNGAPEPRVTSDDRTTMYAWRMENADRLGSPRIEAPESYAPYLSWSMWGDWQRLGRSLITSFDGAAATSDALADSLATRLSDEPSAASKARRVAGLVDEWVRGIHYDYRFWTFAPRAAQRTWETAYGHDLDRAVLAAALFRKAGFGAELAFYATPYSVMDGSVPGLSCFQGFVVVVSGEGMLAFYDPAEGTLQRSGAWTFGKVLWRPGSDGELDVGTWHPGRHDPGPMSGYELIVTLEPKNDGGWNGTGYISAEGIFCPYDEMAGLNGEALARLQGIVGSMLQGAQVNGFNPERFEADFVALGFDFALEAATPDDRGMTRFVIGEPAGGIADHLPPDMRLYHERRGSPVQLPGGMTQRVRLRLRTGDRQVVSMPQPRELENGAGRFLLSVDNEEGWVTIDRELMLTGQVVEPEAWRLLRALLLEDADAGGRTLVLE